MVKEETKLLINKVIFYCIAVNKKIGLLVNFSDFNPDSRMVEINNNYFPFFPVFHFPFILLNCYRF